MAIYQYSMKAPVIYGAGAVGLLGEKVRELGCTRALLVCDEGVSKAGIICKILPALERSGVDVVVYDKVLADPPSKMLDEVGKLGRECKVDVVIGIGGGSSLDTAKAASILQSHEGPITNYLSLEGPPAFVSGGVPTVLIPTSAGTGSESTQIIVVSWEERNEKIVLFTDITLAIVDPELCVTAPPSVTANGGLDALAHAAEAVTARGSNPFSDTIGLSAISRIGKNLLKAINNASDIDARSELSLAANWAGIAFSDANVHIGHAIADSISANYHTPHGLNCAWATPPMLEISALGAPEKVKAVGEALGLVFTGEESAEEIGKKAAECVRELMHSVGIGSMEFFGLERANILAAAETVASYGITANCPTDVTVEEAKKALASAYDNYR